jgi:CDP-diacylglycerol--glycerol-3-phosphate 3-phosphatidyltransferase
MPRAVVLSLPNIVSLTRVALVPVFIASSTPGARVAVVGVAALTDMLDGWLARRHRVASRFGALLDPIADRLFGLAAVATLLFEGALTLGQTCVLLSRDIATTIGFVVARSVTWLRPVELKARHPGKLVTVLQVLTLLALLLWPAAVPALLTAVGVVSAVAVVDYTLMLWRGRAR